MIASNALLMKSHGTWCEEKILQFGLPNRFSLLRFQPQSLQRLTAHPRNPSILVPLVQETTIPRIDQMHPMPSQSSTLAGSSKQTPCLFSHLILGTRRTTPSQIHHPHLKSSNFRILIRGQQQLPNWDMPLIQPLSARTPLPEIPSSTPSVEPSGALQIRQITTITKLPRIIIIIIIPTTSHCQKSSVSHATIPPPFPSILLPGPAECRISSRSFPRPRRRGRTFRRGSKRRLSTGLVHLDRIEESLKRDRACHELRARVRRNARCRGLVVVD